MKGYEVLAEELWEGKGELLLDKRAKYSVHRKFHIFRLGLNSALHHDRPVNKRLSHDKRNYGVGFTVNGIRRFEIFVKIIEFFMSWRWEALTQTAGN
jgi:hypothetical protein